MSGKTHTAGELVDSNATAKFPGYVIGSSWHTTDPGDWVGYSTGYGAYAASAISEAQGVWTATVPLPPAVLLLGSGLLGLGACGWRRKQG